MQVDQSWTVLIMFITLLEKIKSLDELWHVDRVQIFHHNWIEHSFSAL